MRLVNKPLLALTTCIVLGIICSHILQISLLLSFLLFGTCSLLLCIAFVCTKQKKCKPLLFSLITLVTFFSFGILINQVHQPKNYVSHYTNQFSEAQFSDQKHGLLLVIDQRVNSSNYYDKYIVKVKEVNTIHVQGTLLLRIPRDSTLRPLKPGMTVSIHAFIEELPKVLNPNQFDYAGYLNSKFIYHQVTAKADKIKIHSRFTFSLKGLAFEFRSKLLSSLRQHNFSESDVAFMNALILGQKQDLSKDTSTAFRNAGVIHVLAVSGLHVGIILLFLNMALRPLERFTKFGSILKLLTILLLLWVYAVVSGLSPSVLRAVTMFTFIAIAIQTQRRSATLNALIASLLVLLCYEPSYLFETGFQLSYMAVASILFIYPKISQLIRPKNTFLKKIWELSSVTLAAQIGLLPLLLYNFHQFPLLFLLSNIIILPIITILLFSGIVISMLSLTNSLPDILRQGYSSLLDLNQNIIQVIASYDSLILKNIHFSSTLLVSGYIALLLIVIAFYTARKKRLMLTAIALLAISTGFIIEDMRLAGRKELVIFHKTKHSILGVLDTDHLLIYASNLNLGTGSNRSFDPYLRANKASLHSLFALENAYKFNRLKLFRIDSETIAINSNNTTDILWLTDSPKIHLLKVINDLQPSQIIADGSNYKRDMDRWEKTCKKLNIPFHRTDQDGAFIIEPK
ncbi:ComEC/Rec2 family competence protein [Aquimarina sp. 2-A2]|uniref:ComEC/Rec2 family competence protein n=1 Tax=Aquimarina sp. 2-A2 TaxID=3382644 RepID=UPI00387EF420